MTVSTEVAPSIYVACLASYNNGVLHGVHIDLDEGIEEPDVWQAIKEMLARSKEPHAEEWAIHDYSGFGPIRLGENERFSKVLMWAEGIREHGDAYAHWVDDVLGKGYGTTGEDYALDVFNDSFKGEWDSVGAYVQDWWESTTDMKAMEEVLGDLIYHIDWESYGEDFTSNMTVIESGSKVLIYDMTV
jgi:antirestriction protein